MASIIYFWLCSISSGGIRTRGCFAKGARKHAVEVKGRKTRHAGGVIQPHGLVDARSQEVPRAAQARESCFLHQRAQAMSGGVEQWMLRLHSPGFITPHSNSSFFKSGRPAKAV